MTVSRMGSCRKGVPVAKDRFLETFWKHLVPFAQSSGGRWNLVRSSARRLSLPAWCADACLFSNNWLFRPHCSTSMIFHRSICEGYNMCRLPHDLTAGCSLDSMVTKLAIAMLDCGLRADHGFIEQQIRGCESEGHHIIEAGVA